MCIRDRVAHFAVPLAGAVLVAINVRLSPEEVHYICDHSGARLLVVDTELLPPLAPVLERLATVEQVIAVADPLGTPPAVAGDLDQRSYADFLSTGCLLYTSPSPRDRTRSRMPSS